MKPVLLITMRFNSMHKRCSLFWRPCFQATRFFLSRFRTFSPQSMRDSRSSSTDWEIWETHSRSSSNLGLHHSLCSHHAEFHSTEGEGCRRARVNGDHRSVLKGRCLYSLVCWHGGGPKHVGGGGGDVRIYVDLKPLNQRVLREVHPFPKVDDTLA